MSLAEALSSHQPNERTFITETVLISKASLPKFGSRDYDETQIVDSSRNHIDSSRITSTVPLSRISFAAENSNRLSAGRLEPMQPLFKSVVSFKITQQPIENEQITQSARSSMQLLNNWQINKKRENEMLYIQEVVKEDVTARLPLKSKIFPTAEFKNLKRKKRSVFRMPENAKELKNQRFRSVEVDRDFSISFKAGNQSFLNQTMHSHLSKPYEITEESFKKNKKDSPIRISQNNSQEETDEIKIKVMNPVERALQKKFGQLFDKKLQQTNEYLKIREESFKRLRMVEAQMQKVPFTQKSTFQLYEPEQIFPNHYTDAKGTAWANHWFQSQLKLQQRRENPSEVKNNSSNVKFSSKRSLDRSFSVIHSRGNSLPSAITNSFAQIKDRRLSSGIKILIDKNIFGRTETKKFQTQTRSIQEQDVHQEYLEEQMPPDIVDLNKVIQESEGFSKSSMSKGYLMAKLTFDTNFKRKYYEKNLHKEVVSQATDIFSEASQQSVLEEIEKSQDTLRSQLYPRGLSKAVEKIQANKQFRKMVKHAGIKLLEAPDDKEFVANQHFVAQVVQDHLNPVPILQNIDKGQLTLSRVPIKRGLVQGFCGALQRLEAPVTSLTLDRNLLEDSVQAKIIATLGTNPKLESIKTIGNEFNRNSLQALIPILQFDSVAKLQELSISHCNADQRSVFELLKQLLPKRVAITEQELDDVHSYHYESSEEDELLRDKETLKFKKAFKMPQNEIMLTPEPQLNQTHNGNNETKPDPILVLNKKFFDKAVKNQCMTEQENYQIKERQREILQDLKTLITQKKIKEAQEPTPQVKKKPTKAYQHQNTNDTILVHSSLKRLGLASVIENRRVFEMLLKVIEQNHNLQELDVSWNRLLPSMVQDLVIAIAKHGVNLQCLDLSWLNIGGADLSPQQQDLFGAFVARSRCLIHLNLTHTNLEGELLQKVLLNVKRSTTLVAVHLCQAQVGPEHREFIYKRMKAVEVLQEKKQMDFLVKEFESQNKPKYEMLHELMEFEQAVKASKRLQDSLDENHGSHDKDCLIISRVLGHPEIMNSNHWKVTDHCWVCQKWKYSLVFFDQTTNLKHAIQDPEVTQLFKQAIFDDNVNFTKHQMEIKNQDSTSDDTQKSQKDEKNQPNQRKLLKLDTNYICGTFTQWKPNKMHSVSQLVARLENVYFNGPDYLKYRADLFSKYKERLLKCLKYSEPDIGLVNFPRPRQFLGQNENIYVYADFLKPGLHKYTVLQDQQFLKPKAFCVEPFRGKLKVFTREYKLSDVTRKFVKEKSMFKEWQECNMKKLLTGFEYELQFWRIPKFIKDESMQKKIYDTLCQNRQLIGTIYQMLCSQSNYPSLSWLDFQNFLMGLGIVGVPGFQSSDADRVFIAAKVPIKELMGVGLPESFMSRHEFLEALVRVADQRFVGTKQLPNIDVALKSLINIITNNFDIDPYMKWRHQRLWCLEVNDLLENNKQNLTRVYKSFFKEKKTYITKQDAVDLAVWQTSLQIPDKEALQCFGMSKMMCNSDILEREKYDKMVFVEFLEYLGRLAEAKYPGQQMALVDKMEKVLEILFAKYQLTCKSKHVEVEYVSCSEDELDERKYYDWQTNHFGQPRVTQVQKE